MINRGREAGRREEGAMRLGKMKRSGETYRGEKPGRVRDELEERGGRWKRVREREGRKRGGEGGGGDGKEVISGLFLPAICQPPS